MLCSLNLLSRKGNHVHYLNVRCVGSVLSVQSSLYKCYPCKRNSFIYVKKILLPYKNTICGTSECYVLSVIT